MTTEKAQQETGVIENGPQSQEPQVLGVAQDLAVERGTKPTQDTSLPADLIQVEEQRACVQSSWNTSPRPNLLTTHDHQTICTRKGHNTSSQEPSHGDASNRVGARAPDGDAAVQADGNADVHRLPLLPPAGSDKRVNRGDLNADHGGGSVLLILHMCCLSPVRLSLV